MAAELLRKQHLTLCSALPEDQRQDLKGSVLGVPGLPPHITLTLCYVMLAGLCYS